LFADSAFAPAAIEIAAIMPIGQPRRLFATEEERREGKRERNRRYKRRLREKKQLSALTKIAM